MERNMMQENINNLKEQVIKSSAAMNSNITITGFLGGLICCSPDRINEALEAAQTMPPDCDVVIFCNSINSEIAVGETEPMKKIEDNIYLVNYNLNELDFSLIRNKGKSYLNTEWIINIDSDERLMIHEWHKLIEQIKTAPSDCGGLLLWNISLHPAPGNEVQIMSLKALRVFRNDKNLKWQFKAHEQLSISLAELGYKMYDSDCFIQHNGYNTSIPELKKKWNRNLVMMLKEISFIKDKKQFKHYMNLIQREFSLLNMYNNKD